MSKGEKHGNNAKEKNDMDTQEQAKFGLFTCFADSELKYFHCDL